MSAGIGSTTYTAREFPFWVLTRSLGLLVLLMGVFGGQPPLIAVGAGLVGMDKVIRA